MNEALRKLRRAGDALREALETGPGWPRYMNDVVARWDKARRETEGEPMTERKRDPRPGEGRPKLGDGESVRVTFIATAEQLSRWDDAAEREGVDRSEWIRDALDEAAR